MWGRALVALFPLVTFTQPSSSSCCCSASLLCCSSSCDTIKNRTCFTTTVGRIQEKEGRKEQTCLFFTLIIIYHEGVDDLLQIVWLDKRISVLLNPFWRGLNQQSSIVNIHFLISLLFIHSLCTPVFTGCSSVETISGTSTGCDLAAFTLEGFLNTM